MKLRTLERYVGRFCTISSNQKSHPVRMGAGGKMMQFL